ncbi:MAG: hypothetical protein FWG18_01185 [Alphaproteobacteria bacterium]|nr:hypothetical protein [Alphaproteobacteria bacterium]
MKKLSIILAGALALTACTQTYYNGRVSYAQSNQDCVYQFSQSGDNSAKRFDENKHVIHKNALCSQVMANDMGMRNPVMVQPQPQRVVMPQPAPVFQTVPVQRSFYTVEPSCRNVRYNNETCGGGNFGREIEIIIQ